MSTSGDFATTTDPKRPGIRKWTLPAAFLVWVVTTGIFAHGHSFSDDPVAGLWLSHPVTKATTDRLVVILTDSVPFDMAFSPKIWPCLSQMRKRATWGMLWTAEPTMTSVMINTILTGNWPTTWTVVRDWHMQSLAHETWVDGLDHAGLRVVGYGDIPWSEQVGNRLASSYTIAEEGKTALGRPIHWESKLLDMSPRIFDAGLRAAQAEDYDVLIWHIVATDQVMHLAFRDTAMTKRVLGFVEERICRLLDSLDDGRTTFLLLSDHGCAANGRHGTQDPEARPAYWLMFGKGVTANLRMDARQVDVAPTILSLFGLSPNAPSAGRVLWQALDVPWAKRAKLTAAALRQRIQYLDAKRHITGRGPDMEPWQKKLSALNQALADGRFRQVCLTSDRIMRNLALAAFRTRRSNDTVEALAWWVGLGLLLFALLAGLADMNGTLSLPRAYWLLGTAVLAFVGALLANRIVVPVAVALSSAGWIWPTRRNISLSGKTVALGAALLGPYLVGVTILHLWTGRLCNTIIFDWTTNAESVFVWAVDGLALAGLAVLFLLRRRIRPSLAQHPLAWILAAAIILAGANGYYQGFYYPFFLLLWVLLLWTEGEPFDGKSFLARSSRALPPILAAVGLLYWQTTWDRHCFHIRYWLDAHQALGCLTAAVAMLLATAATTWNTRALDRPGLVDSHETDIRRVWLVGAAAAVLAAGLQGLHPVRPEHLSASLGSHLFQALPGQVAAMGLLTMVQLGLRGWRSRAATLIYLIGLTVLSGSPFEATVTALLMAFMVSLAGHPVFVGPSALVASVFTFLALRVGLHIVFDFKFNFTGIHDLMGFPARVTGPIFLRSLAVGTVRFLPATLTAAFFAFGRLNPDTRRKAVGATMFLLAARILFIVVVMHLSRFQLYLNWRNTGEAIFYGIWIVGLVLFVGIEGAWNHITKRVRQRETSA